MSDNDQEAKLRLNVESPQSYESQRQEMLAEQTRMDRRLLRQQLFDESEAAFDPEDLPAVKHNWHDQGLKMACWGAGHPTHMSWKH